MTLRIQRRQPATPAVEGRRGGNSAPRQSGSGAPTGWPNSFRWMSAATGNPSRLQHARFATGGDGKAVLPPPVQPTDQLLDLKTERRQLVGTRVEPLQPMPSQ